jgi:hypothetical protein
MKAIFNKQMFNQLNEQIKIDTGKKITVNDTTVYEVATDLGTLIIRGLQKRNSNSDEEVSEKAVLIDKIIANKNNPEAVEITEAEKRHIDDFMRLQCTEIRICYQEMIDKCNPVQEGATPEENEGV